MDSSLETQMMCIGDYEIKTPIHEKSNVLLKILLSTLMASVICLHFDMQDGVILEHTSAKCHLCTF
jgi:hypothetical protein